jgi:hypothetical protein
MISVVQNTPQGFQHIHGGSFESTMSTMKQPLHTVNADVVGIRKPNLLSDGEAAVAMGAVQDSLSSTPSEAMSIHNGLDESRVMALLADL